MTSSGNFRQSTKSRYYGQVGSLLPSNQVGAWLPIRLSRSLLKLAVLTLTRQATFSLEDFAALCWRRFSRLKRSLYLVRRNGAEAHHSPIRFCSYSVFRSFNQITLSYSVNVMNNRPPPTEISNPRSGSYCDQGLRKARKFP